VGGYGSGRHDGRPTIESTASYVLNIKTLVLAFPRGKCLGGSIPFDEGRFTVTVLVDLRNERNCIVELIHPTRDVWEDEAGTVFDKVQLTRTQPPFGGHRWWFLCPRTGHRTTKLFLPNGGRHFWSRRAYGLGYACQREDRFSRLQRRAATLNQQLGGQGWSTWDLPPPKPKWIRWRTYERKIARWQRTAERAEIEWTFRATRLVARLDRRRVIRF
jgi:hypothetical protein